jgi:hypothetical protein
MRRPEELMASYLCTVGRQSPQNWALCKQVGMWGIPFGRYRRRTPVEVGDRLLVWIGGRGYVAEAVVTDPPRPPRNRDEAPWSGGIHRFALVVPMSVAIEVRTPVRLPFMGDRQAETDLPTVMFQRSFALLSETTADHISGLLAKRVVEEDEQQQS